MPEIEYGYALLLIVSFLAATLLPLSSEAVLGVMLVSGNHSPLPLWLCATVGNVTGAQINWLLGRYLRRFQHHPWFPIKAATLEKARNRYLRWGEWSLLLSWVPIIGDPLTLMGGVLRIPFSRFTLLVTLAKGGRYGVVLFLLSA